MENFLKEYVKDIADTSNMKLDANQINNIVNRLMDIDAIWQVLDEYTCNEIMKYAREEIKREVISDESDQQ